MRFLNLLVFAFAFCKSTAQPVAFAVSREFPAYHSNVVYAGLKNLIRIDIPDIIPNNLQLLPTFGEIRPDSVTWQFIWKITHLDSSRVLLILKNRKNNQVIDTVTFKVKMIPPPEFALVPRGNCLPGGKPDLTTPVGIAAVLENFQFEVRCNMVDFTVFFYPKGQDTLHETNNGARFKSRVSDWVQKAKPGDKYAFRDFRYQCGCDATVRRSMEVLNFEIK